MSAVDYYASTSAKNTYPDKLYDASMDYQWIYSSVARIFSLPNAAGE